MYEGEIIENTERIEKMRQDGKDEYDIKKAHEVLDESEMMIPHTTRRIQEASEDLEAFIVLNSKYYVYYYSDFHLLGRK